MCKNHKNPEETNFNGAKKKRVYSKPAVKEKEMRAYFMLCSTNPGKCAPCTQLRQSGGRCL